MKDELDKYVIKQIASPIIFGMIFVFVGALIRAIAYFQTGYHGFSAINAFSIIMRILGFFIISYGLIKSALETSELNGNARVAMILVAALIIGFAFSVL